MADQVWAFACLIPAGTPKNAPVTVNMTIPPVAVGHITIRVPPGPRGSMGFALGAVGKPVLPYNAGAYIITDDEVIEWDLEDQITSGAWQLIGYNTGTFDHTVYVTLLSSLIPVGAGVGTSALDASQLSGLPSASGSTGGTTVPSVPQSAQDAQAALDAIQPPTPTAPALSAPPGAAGLPVPAPPSLPPAPVLA